MDDRSIDAIRSVPLSDIMAAFGDAVEREGNDRLLALCPFHEDHNPSFSGFRGQDGRWHFRCFAASCGAHGDVLDYVGQRLFGAAWSPRDKAQFAEVLRWFYDHQSSLGISVANPDERARSIRRSAPPPPVKRRPAPPKEPVIVAPTPKIQRVWAWFLAVAGDLLYRDPSEEAAEARAYIRKRGFTEETLRRGRFGWTPSHRPRLLLQLGKAAGYPSELLVSAGLLRQGERGLYPHFRGRIVFAETDRVGNPAYILGRILPSLAKRKEAQGKKVIKYLGLPGFTKPILGLESIGRRKAPIFLLEGPWDAWLVRQWGFDALAISGGMISEVQVRQLLNLDRPLIPIPDNDEGGEIALSQWHDLLPTLQPPLRLPHSLHDEDVKDVGDLAKLPDGPKLFIRLARQRL